MEQFFSNWYRTPRNFKSWTWIIWLFVTYYQTKIFFLYFQKNGNLKYQKPWKKFGKYACWGRKHGETLCDSLGKPGPGTDPELVSLIIPEVSPYTLPRGAEFLDDLLNWVSITVPANWCTGWHRMYFLWHFDPRYQMLIAPRLLIDKMKF